MDTMRVGDSHPIGLSLHPRTDTHVIASASRVLDLIRQDTKIDNPGAKKSCNCEFDHSAAVASACTIAS